MVPEQNGSKDEVMNRYNYHESIVSEQIVRKDEIITTTMESMLPEQNIRKEVMNKYNYHGKHGT